MRTRKTSDAWMPERVYRGKTSYEWRPKGGGCVSLCRLPKDGNENEGVKRHVWRELDQAKSKAALKEDVNFLIKRYLASGQYKALSTRTQKDYRGYSKRIIVVFGNMAPMEVTPKRIRDFMDKLGEKYPVAANRHHTFLLAIFGWAYERDMVLRNPASGIKKFKEKPRDRYIEDWEFDLVYEVARESSYPWIAPMMEFAYLCRMRSIEVRELSEKHILADGVFVDRHKDSENEITAWTPRLKQALKDARVAFPDAPTTMDRPIFHNARGVRVIKDSYSTAWSRVIKRALEIGTDIDGETVTLKERFTFHDIKAKGVTDHKDKYAGHRSKKMQAVYDRKPSIRDATR